MTYTLNPLKWQSLGPIASMPYTARIPSSSNCQTLTSSVIFTGLLTPTATSTSSKPTGMTTSKAAARTGSGSGAKPTLRNLHRQLPVTALSWLSPEPHLWVSYLLLFSLHEARQLQWVSWKTDTDILIHFGPLSLIHILFIPLCFL